MAYSNGQKFDKTDNLLFFSPRAKDANGQKVKPFFTITKLVGDKFEKLEETATEVTGSLVKIDVKDREYNGVVGKEAKLYLKDGVANEMYVLSLSFRMDSRSLFNGLVNLQNNEPITISIYENKKGYTAYSLKQNGVRVDWKFSQDDLPQPESVVFKGKKQYDYTVVDNFYAERLQELSDFLFGKKAIETPKIETAKATSTEDVPF